MQGATVFTQPVGLRVIHDCVLGALTLRTIAITRRREYSKVTSPGFGFFFDIDGVFVRGNHPLKAGRQALQRLTDQTGRFRVPTVFVTNAGNALRDQKAESLSEHFDVKITRDQVIMAHSPLSMFQQYHHRHFLVSGQGPTREIANAVGFKNVTTVEELRDRFPALDVVDMRRRNIQPAVGQEFRPIEGVLLLGEPINWETSLQLITDVLVTDGQPTHRPTDIKASHIPVLACNMDLLWMAEAPLPRFGHGTFLLCLESIYRKLTGHELRYTALVGKPSEATYHHAEDILAQQAKAIGLGNAPISRIYAVGDNPDTDIFGANLYDMYLRHKSTKVSKDPGEIGEVEQMHTALGAGATSEISRLLHHKPVTSHVSEEVKDLPSAQKDEYMTDRCISILVESGVFSPTHTQTLNHQHRDFHERRTDLLNKPDYTCKNVLEAVNLVFHLEKFPGVREGG
ncbi:hypothetical protein RvY_18830 [Ramazzottius varieornatus]|uniref:Haloacid dehalogenase-like hydrolase domain-containing 5 n=1 Tax=Ramazzottius varieornatus TaxID=947166 RepID=A0A1D1W762_RAMVA|nr:hypothetical protein RvY_18830 [Ramazzottius varieornatus]